MLSTNIYDPVFAKYGMKILTAEYIDTLRLENLANPDNKCNIIPQEGFQEKVLMNDADILIIGGNRGGGKVMPNDTDVLTPFGFRKKGDLQVGDTISNPVTGGFQKVIAIYEHPDHEFYELTFDDGSTCECGLEHLWKIRRTSYAHKTRHINNTGIDADWRISTFGAIKKFLDEKKGGKYKVNHLVIPLCEPTKFTRPFKGAGKIDIDPYVIGAILGDGCVTDKATANYDCLFCTNDDFIIDQFTQSGVDVSAFSVNRNAKEFRINDKRLQEFFSYHKLYGCYSNAKFIPEHYKWGTIEERWAILQGLMDTDGYVDSRGHCFFNSTSEKLSADVKFIIESLGGSVTTSKKKAGYRKNGNFIKCNDCYELYIKIKDTKRLFRLPRKKERCKPFNGGISEVCKRIVGYRYVGRKDGRCITVDSVDGLYMVNNCIVTHNTFVMELAPMRYIDNPLFSAYGFRREEDDITRGLWATSKKIYSDIATPYSTSFTWRFPSSAFVKFEHLAFEKDVDRRFRGVEIPFMFIDELPQITHTTFFTLLGANRNTLGLQNQFIASCNPVGDKHWVYKFLSWYIDPETKTIIPERDGVKRYFFKWGKDIGEITWGDSKEEVYGKAQHHIDAVWDEALESQGRTKLDLINSLCFIEGKYRENRIFVKLDPRYLGNLVQQGGDQSRKDIAGIWSDSEEGESIIPLSALEAMFTNIPQKTGKITAVADVGLTRDDFVIGAFDGNHLFALEAHRGVGSMTVLKIIERFLAKHSIRLSDFLFDSDGVGNYLKEPLKADKGGAVPYNNNSAASDKSIWYNLRAECADMFSMAVKEMRFSIEPHLLDTKFGNMTLREHLINECRVLRQKGGNNSKFQIISKAEMKILLGKVSTNFLDVCVMSQYWAKKKKKSNISGLNLLKNF